MKSKVLIVGLAFVSLLAFVNGGCSANMERTDMSGLTQDKAAKRSAESVYESAALQHRQLNELLAAELTALHPKTCQLSGVRMEIYPLDGGGMDNYLPGATKENSYYFEVTRKCELRHKAGVVLSKVADHWSDRGWKVREITSGYSGSSRIEAITDKGYWIAADEESDGLYLTAHTPPYWGEYLPLADDIHERYLAEKERGEHARFDIGEDEQISLLPGEYRPFPRWDAVD